MTEYRLYCTGASGNSYKVALYLNCCGLDWEPIGVDLGARQTHDAIWRADFNAMGEIPVLEVDGQRRSQSGAILTWLADALGKFAPTDAERFEAMRWLLFDNHRFSNNYAMHRVQNSFTPKAADPAVMTFLRSRVETTFSIVEKHLLDRSFMLGERATIVDFSMVGYVYYPVEETGFDIAAQFPAIDAWRRRVAMLPGWKLPYVLMPVGSSLPQRTT
jgi:glutathione S-transferase